MNLFFNSGWYILILIDNNTSTYQWDKNLHVKYICFYFQLESKPTDFLNFSWNPVINMYKFQHKCADKLEKNFSLHSCFHSFQKW